MRREPRKYPHDMQRAVDALGAFTAGKRFDDYRGDTMLRAAVEHEFGIIG